MPAHLANRLEIDDAAEPYGSERGAPLSAIGARCAAQAQHRQSYVLFVDDDDANLEVWKASCGDEFRVLTASGADDALVLLRSHEVGVILADQRMPGTTGIELLAKVRSESPETIR